MPDSRPVYLDCNATTPVDPRVRQVMLRYLDVEYGNAGSRTHVYGQAAAKGVKKAREQVASVVTAAPEEVVFTSGATEANNLAIRGLADYGQRTGKQHILSTQIEHKAVLEPLKLLAKIGFEVELVPPKKEGIVDPSEIARRLRKDTLLVSVMHVNNETGAIQPLEEISNQLDGHDAFFHVDAAQGFGKEVRMLKSPRIDLISASSHKLHGPVGVGCLVVRRTRKVSQAMKPLQVGGGQERGLRAGTIPTFLICGFGEAADLAIAEHEERSRRWMRISEQMHEALAGLPVRFHGPQDGHLKNVMNFSVADIDAELVILALKDLVSIATGSACTSSAIEPSHVIRAMYSDDSNAHSACRASWCHMTPDLPVAQIEERLAALL